MDIVALKHLHVTLALISIVFFLVRFGAREAGAGFVHTKPIRIAPHVIDTLLLVTGFTLAGMMRFSPGDHPWLMGKLILIVVYIGFGIAAMKSGSFGKRMIFALLALSTFITIMVLAFLKPYF
ncbi:SirB2 family protein [Marinimicrobium alkaliphilum]|uniref:SirB2 family protein n=1 Tax=Marinimicrobium alkaliphilum TaxID=2202654 RepID=UPI000DBAD61E|nr:SirB2 family protein [Marinimicrobium alkaliphilum]